MKKLLYIIIILLQSQYLFSQEVDTQTTLQLATRYFTQQDYEKAAPLYKELFENSNSRNNLKQYLECLYALKDYETAEKLITDQITRTNNSVPEYFIYWGYIFKLQGNMEEATEKYEQAFRVIPQNETAYLVTANEFYQKGIYDMAARTYLQGREILGIQSFTYELARIYLQQYEYDNMMEEILQYVKTEENNLSRAQSLLSAAMSRDLTDELRSNFRNIVLKRIQEEPNVIAYNRLLIWFFTQERKFTNALRQTIALDRRTGQEDVNIIGLAQSALNNRYYDEARDAYDYILKKGKENPFYLEAYVKNLHASYLYYIQEEPDNLQSGINLSKIFSERLDSIGYISPLTELIIEYADLLAFYLEQTDNAIEVLNRGLGINNLTGEQLGKLKTKLADVYVYLGDPWESTLIYSQVIEENKETLLGDEAKLKKAKLAYYQGNFSWAQAQLDVLKASTSKLTANDALELSLLIGNNMDLDTTDIPLQMFARADLYFFMNKDSLALTVIDSIENYYPYHSLVDDVLYRKATIHFRNNNYDEAIAGLEKIINEYPYDYLVDDAMFLLAQIYDYNLGQKDKAQELYNQLLIEYPGSIYVSDSRERFRVLRGDTPKEENQEDNLENLFFERIIP